MTTQAEATLLWEPSEEVKQGANLTAYMGWLEREHGLSFASYDELWRWSVDDIEAFWASLWEYFDVQAS